MKQLQIANEKKSEIGTTQRKRDKDESFFFLSWMIVEK